MGTNYYHHKMGQHPVHIGKSSGGWCFALHVIPEKDLNSLDDWKQRWGSRPAIRDEYGDKVTKAEMLRIITERSHQRRMEDVNWEEDFMNHYNDLNHFLDRNHAELGPNNLLRHRVGPYCAGHGEGTWDLIEGDFS